MPDDKEQRVIAQRFHEVYEQLAPSYGWKTQPESRVSWDELPPSQRELMVATVKRVLDESALRPSLATPIPEIVIICGALTDPENQPHQWMNDRDRLVMELVDVFSRMQK